jgi:PAS domain S-box-containing protein
VAVRVTFLLALALTLVVTVAGLGPPASRALYWLLTLGYGYLSFSSRPTERFLAAYTSLAWLGSGVGTVLWSGLAGGGPILVASVALVGSFFGSGPALLVVVVCTAFLGWVGTLTAAGHLPALLTGFDPALFPAQWTAATAAFAGVSTMTALVQSAVLERARKASARARSFALATELTDDAVIICDARRAIVWVNDGFVRLTGRTQEEVVGRTPGAFLQGPGTSEEARAHMRRALDRGEGFEIELVNVHGDGTPYWLRLHVQPLRDASGAFTGFAGVQRAITAERLRRELDALEAALTEALVHAPGTDAALELVAEHFATLSLVARAALVGGPEGDVRVLAWRRSSDPHLSAHLAVDLTPPASLPLSGVVEESSPAPGAGVRFAVSLPLGLRTGLILDLDEHMPGREELRARLPEVALKLAQILRRREEQARFEVIFDRSPTFMLLLDAHGRIERCNERARAFWPGLGEGAEAHLALGTERDVVDRALALGPGGRLEAAWSVESPGGAVGHVEATFAVMPTDTASRVLVTARDVTARRLAEQSLAETMEAQARSLAEREVLLREIHHRVKNNLQIVSSLLAMQADRTQSDEARAALTESGARVRSMALVHQLLYGGRDLAGVDLGEYVRILSTELRAALDPRAELDLDLGVADVTIETAVPSALVLNELLTNALKHGRSPDGVCRVRVAVAQDPTATTLRVEDRGPGLPSGGSGAGPIGMKIVTALVRQLGARLSVESDGGARFRIIIPREAPRAGGSAPRPPTG